MITRNELAEKIALVLVEQIAKIYESSGSIGARQFVKEIPERAVFIADGLSDELVNPTMVVKDA